MASNNQQVETKNLDIFDISHLNNQTVIVQQCNVVRRKPHGLSAEFVQKLGAYTDPYSKRSGKTPNTAIVSDRPKVGTISWCHPNSPNLPYVVNFFAQFDSGKAIESDMYWHFSGTKYLKYDHVFHDNHYLTNKKSDTGYNRLKYFMSCLAELTKDLDFMSCTSKCDDDDSQAKISKIIFPFKIGCGPTGGVWQDYKEAINDFSEGVSQSVIIAKKPEHHTCQSVRLPYNPFQNNRIK